MRMDAGALMSSPLFHHFVEIKRRNKTALVRPQMAKIPATCSGIMPPRLIQPPTASDWWRLVRSLSFQSSSLCRFAVCKPVC